MKTKSTKLMAAFVLLVVAMLGCKKPVETKVPIVTLLENSLEIGHNTAVLYAEVTDDGGAAITKRGFCFGKADGSVDTLLCEASGPFSAELTDLTPLTAYKCCAFADNVAGRGFSSEFSFTTETDTVPRVKTWYVREITHCSAVASGQVLGSGGQTVMERGVCYGTEPLPTVANTCITAGTGVGPFDCQMTDLTSETGYYVRAYAKCTQGVYYGAQVEFFTDPLPLEVRTLLVSDVTATRVRAQGRVVRDGGLEVTECGFCWSTEHDPTIEGNHVWAGYGARDFSRHFSGLVRGVTQYVRAYAINEKGIAYGEELEFVPDDPFMPWPEGTLPGLFSVSADRQVRFSQGNLQYNPSRGVWRFAERQWDFVGGECGSWDGEISQNYQMGTVYENGVKCDNTLVYGNYEGWVDLFGWGTSGWDNGNVYYRPYDYASHEYVCAFYGPVGNYDLTGDYVNADWGIYNTISNGGSRQWRTPTVDEYRYLLMERETPSGIRFAKADVAGVKGLIVLPDDWSEATYYLKSTNVNIDYSANKISGAEWLDMLEPAGAVFFPAAGNRDQSVPGESKVYYWNDDLFSINCGARYWTSSCWEGVDYASTMFFYGSEEGYYSQEMLYRTLRCVGNPVRLISVE